MVFIRNFMTGSSRRNFLKAAAAPFHAIRILEAQSASAEAQATKSPEFQLVQNSNARPDPLRDEILTEISKGYRFIFNRNSATGKIDGVFFKSRDDVPTKLDVTNNSIEPPARIIGLNNLQKNNNDLGADKPHTIFFPKKSGGTDSNALEFSTSDLVEIEKIFKKKEIPLDHGMLFSDDKPFAKTVLAISPVVLGNKAELHFMVLSTGLLRQCQKEKSFIRLEKAIEAAINPPVTVLA